jgi:hypothetical protein
MAFAGLVSFLMVACGSSGTPAERLTKHAWEIKADPAAGMEDTQTWLFKADGTYTQKTTAFEEDGKYKLDAEGKKITLISGATDMETAFAIGELTNSELTLVGPNDVKLQLTAAGN